jgi:Uma2 family endonuclease
LATPGVKALVGPTVILGPSAEPQPDALLIIEPGLGGKTRIERPDGEREDYVAGPPELVVEVASSSVAYDLHSKQRDYEKSGVTEYLVVLVREASVRWFRRQEDRFINLAPAEDGSLRSQVFPGLWLDGAALVARDYSAVIGTLQLGLASPEHAAFVEHLASRASRD